MSVEFESPPRGIRIFREADASSVRDAQIMERKASAIVEQRLAKMFDAGLADAYVTKCLYKSLEPDGVSLVYAWFKANHPLPVHSHNSNCLYYIISGDVRMGTDVLGQGDGFFVPADVNYSYVAGPDGVEILEFRDSSAFDIKIRDGSPRAWERLTGICEANQALWKTQRPPTRRVPGEDS